MPRKKWRLKRKFEPSQYRKSIKYVYGPYIKNTFDHGAFEAHSKRDVRLQLEIPILKSQTATG